MTIVFNQKENRRATILSNIYSTFEESITGLHLIDFKNRFSIKEDPISKQHIIVENEINPDLEFRIEKRDIELANNSRHMLYHVLATVLNHFDNVKKDA